MVKDGDVGGGGRFNSQRFLYSVAFGANEAVSRFSEDVATGRIYPIEVILGSTPPYSFIGSSGSVC